jgi:pyrroloquinoline quinone biosynthesis protein E
VREAVSLGVRRIEVAHSQYYGWALKNRAALRRSGRRSPKYLTVSPRNRPLKARIETRARPSSRRRAPENVLTH